MELVLKVRDRSGAPWYSACGGEAYNDKLRLCLANDKLGPAALGVIRRLLGPGIEGVKVAEEGGVVKVVCRRERLRATIPIEHPHRAATANAFNAFASRFSAAPAAAATPAPACSGGEKLACVPSPKLSFEARVRARLDLGPDATQARVSTRAYHQELRGAHPDDHRHLLCN
jgi:hypothetical protein